MENSAIPSQSLTLRDLYSSSNVRQINVNDKPFVAENVDGEQFRLVPLPALVDGLLAYYATRI
jgi:hypothetical protein